MSGEFFTVNCRSCGVVFGLPAHFAEALRKTNNTFYCPNGDGLSFQKATLADIKDRTATFHPPRLTLVPGGKPSPQESPTCD